MVNQTSRNTWAGGALAVIATGAMVASCGGGGGSAVDPAAEAATIDAAGVSKAIADVSAFVGICQGTATGSSVGADASPVVQRSLGLLARQRQLRLGQAPTMRAQAYTSTTPADTLGDCGGRFGYPSYSHSSGITTAVLQFTDYCTVDPDTGHREVMNGSVSFVNTATPTASGPITTRWQGGSSGLAVVSRNSAGSVLSSQTLSFDQLVYVVGVPGGSPSAANPDTVNAAEFKVVNNSTGKTYRQTGYRITAFETATGGEQMSLAGRGYRSDGSWFDISTTTPMVVDAAGNYASGTLTFSGANGSQAVATLVPGAALQATLTVNGSPVTGVPACKK